MPELLLIVAALCCAALTAALLRMLRPPRPLEAVARACAAAVLAAAVVVPAGWATGADTAEFLLASSFAAAPVAALLGAAAEEAAPGRRGPAWVLVLVWAGIVFPASAVLPPLLMSGCRAECRVEDFGGALALLVSAAAAALPAWRAAAVSREQGEHGILLPTVVIWVSGSTWLASLEGVVDEYTPRILLAALVASLGGGAGWVLADLLRRTTTPPARSACYGLLAGLVAITPGAATISFPWSLVVGAMGGGLAALVFGWRRLASGGRAGHGALVVLASTAVGYLAPAVSGDTVGFLFTGRIGALLPPVAAFLAVAAFGALASAPAWALLRRRRR